MTKKSLRKSHDDIVRFMKKVIKSSDKHYGAHLRTPECDKQYLEAKKLIAEAPRAARR